MNRNLLFHLAAILLLQTVATGNTFSQEVKKWSFGVSSRLTSEKFGVTIDSKYQNQITATHAYKANSGLNFGGALWVERMLSPTFSLIPQFGYEIVKVNDNVLSGGLSKSGSGADLKETHHYVSFALHLRKYFMLKSKLRLFADAGVTANRLVCFKNEY